MADSYVQYTTDGTTGTFTVPFPYLEQTDVSVQLNGVTMQTPGDYTWLNAGSIQFNTKPPGGNTLVIARQTSPDGPLVSFQNGAVLTAQDLNTACLQAFYRTQELQDQLNTYITAGVARYSVTGANPLVTPSDLLDAAADAALQTDLAQTLLGAMNDINLNASSILTNTNQIATLQSTLDSLTSSIPGGIGTYLTNETNSRISGDQALQQQINLIGAVNGGNTAFILDTSTVYVDSTTSMADRLSGLDTVDGTNAAAIATEATTRASADTAAATLITSLTSTVGANTAAITTQASSIAGLQAQYVVKIDANGNVAGYGLAAGGGAPSQFTVLANKFAVIDPGAPGGTPTVPFSISSGVVYMQNVVIGGALIQDLTIGTGKLAANAVSNAYGGQDTTGYTIATGSGGGSTGNGAGASICPVTFTPTDNGTLFVHTVVQNVSGSASLLQRCTQSGTTVDGVSMFPTGNAGTMPIVSSFNVVAGSPVTIDLVLGRQLLTGTTIGTVNTEVLFIKK